MKRPLVRLSYRGVQERQTASDIDPNSFYTLRNELSPGNTLSSGSYRDANGTVNMTVAFAYSSSENWQFYYQKGRYFIRNYDYGSDWQLGLSEESRSVPTLMKRSGSLSQQWTLTREDGKTTLTNGLLGNGSWLALAEKNTVPGMQPSKTGAMWDIVLNYSAGKVQDQGMLVEISDIEEPPSSSTSAKSSSSTASTTSLTSSTSVTSLSPSTTSSTSLTSSTSGAASTSSPLSSSSSKARLSTGGVAGIAFGGAMVLLLCALLGCFFWSRRRSKKGQKLSSEMETTERPIEMDSRPELIMYKYVAELEPSTRPRTGNYEHDAELAG